MQKHRRLAVLGLIVGLAGAGVSAQSSAKTSVEEIRKELLQMPYYGVFDFIGFGYNKGTVTLVGYAYHPGLKGDAERAVKRASGVDMVVDKIEELPPSPNDDQLRWKIYYQIYRDPFLSKCAWRRAAVGPSARICGPVLAPRARVLPRHRAILRGHERADGREDVEPAVTPIDTCARRYRTVSRPSGAPRSSQDARRRLLSHSL
jgi:hypothetical protein